LVGQTGVGSWACGWGSSGGPAAGRCSLPHRSPGSRPSTPTCVSQAGNAVQRAAPMGAPLASGPCAAVCPRGTSVPLAASACLASAQPVAGGSHRGKGAWCRAWRIGSCCCALLAGGLAGCCPWGHCHGSPRACTWMHLAPVLPVPWTRLGCIGPACCQGGALDAVVASQRSCSSANRPASRSCCCICIGHNIGTHVCTRRFCCRSIHLKVPCIPLLPFGMLLCRSSSGLYVYPPKCLRHAMMQPPSIPCMCYRVGAQLVHIWSAVNEQRCRRTHTSAGALQGLQLWACGRCMCRAPHARGISVSSCASGLVS
jgi:hypothetical protein